LSDVAALCGRRGAGQRAVLGVVCQRERDVD